MSHYTFCVAAVWFSFCKTRAKRLIIVCIALDDSSAKALSTRVCLFNPSN